MKERIVQAASDEFASVGYDGARIERIAEAAGCNRSLVYFYFGGKGGLFRAALDAAAEIRTGQMADQPRSLAEGLIYWFRQNAADTRRIRLVMQEALAPPLHAGDVSERRAYLQRQLDVVRSFQKSGLLRADIDARHLLTVFLALTSFPVCFPQIAAAALGTAGDDELAAEWSSCLRDVAAFLSPEPPTEPS